jgi:hypothetical protein
MHGEYAGGRKVSFAAAEGKTRRAHARKEEQQRGNQILPCQLASDFHFGVLALERRRPADT